MTWVVSWPSMRIRPPSDREEPREQAEQGGLAGAVRPDDRDDLALVHLEGESPGPAGSVRFRVHESHIIERDPVADERQPAFASVLVVFGWAIDELEHALGGGVGPLELGIDSAELARGVEHAGHTNHHLNEARNRDFIGVTHVGEIADERGTSDESKRLDERRADRLDESHLDLLFEQVAIDFEQLVAFIIFARVRFDDSHADECVLESGKHLAVADKQAAVGLSDLAAELAEYDNQDRRAHQKQEGQFPVDGHGDREYAEGLEGLRHTLLKEIVHAAENVRHVLDETAHGVGRIFAEPRERHLEHVGVHLLANVEDGPGVDDDGQILGHHAGDVSEDHERHHQGKDDDKGAKLLAGAIALRVSVRPL